VHKMSALHDSVNSLSEETGQVAVRTSAVGRESLMRDLRCVSDDHQAVSTDAKELLEQLQTLLQKWTNFDLSHGSFTCWLETATQSVSNAREMPASLDAKLEQVNRVKVGFILMSYFTVIFMSSVRFLESGASRENYDCY